MSLGRGARRRGEVAGLDDDDDDDADDDARFRGGDAGAGAGELAALLRGGAAGIGGGGGGWCCCTTGGGGDDASVVAGVDVTGRAYMWLRRGSGAGCFVTADIALITSPPCSPSMRDGASSSSAVGIGGGGADTGW